MNNIYAKRWITEGEQHLESYLPLHMCIKISLINEMNGQHSNQILYYLTLFMNYDVIN